jgi:hypothetical protein
LFTINPNNTTVFLIDKWGLPIEKQGIEQPESIKLECSKRQQWSHYTLNLYLTGDPFFMYGPTHSVQCGMAIGRKFKENLLILDPPINQPQQEAEI